MLSIFFSQWRQWRSQRRGGKPPLALRKKYFMYIVKNKQSLNNQLNMCPKQAKFDRKCSKMRWRLGLRPRPHWGNLRLSPKPPNREGKPFPSYILGYATEWRTQELMMGGVCPSTIRGFGECRKLHSGSGHTFLSI